jgi:type IV pilus assembly protein PilB
MTNLKIDETRIPQDGRFHAEIIGRDIDFRVSTFPTPWGEKVAIRVLDPSVGLRELKDLGLRGQNEKLLREGMEKPFGMILFTGPTGSGKTTTLYALLQLINKDVANVVSLEDPVEYFMEGMNQSQVRPEIGYDFISGLRQILRQDPDVIMVGEIRDAETAGLAVNAALTGHIMLSTLHTNNALGVVSRLMDLGVPPFLLSSSLNLMLAQRLVLQLCPACKKEMKAPPEFEKAITSALANLPQEVKTTLAFTSPFSVFHANIGSSCSTCKGKGTVGRIALFEIFQMTKELMDIISSGFTESKLAGEAKRQGMIPLRGDGILKALEGTVMFEDVLKETTE